MEKNKIKIIEYGALTSTKGGIESYIITQLRHINKDKFQIDFLVPNEYEELAYEHEIKALNSKIYRGYIRWKNSFFGHYYTLYKFFREHKGEYDIAIGNYLDLQNINFLIMAKIYGIKVEIAHAHAGENLRKNWKRNLLVKINRFLLYFIVDYLYSCSQEAGKWMFGDKLWNKKKHFIIENSIETKSFLFDINKRNYLRNFYNVKDAIVIGHTGRFAKEKNHDFIIDIFYELVKKGKNVYLFLIGDGILRSKIEKKIKELQLNNRVFILGERNDVNELLNMMDIFLFPSKTEGLGISLIEAQINGLYCFTSKDVVPNSVKFTDHLNFISLNKGAIYWANEILKVSKKNREIYNEKKVISNYNIDNTIKIIEKIFSEVVK
ncbi:glycosyltransferase [Megamonas funiformis]